jgi:hypothetical protein
VRWLIACVLTIVSSSANADGALYADLHIAAAGVKHSNLDFYPQYASVSAGLFVRPGIGLEVFADSGLASDRKRGFNLRVENAYGVAIRLQSPAVRRVHGYIVIGAVNYSVKQTASATNSLGGSSIAGDFTGMRVSVGMVERLKRWENVMLSLEYRHYNADDPMRVDALLLGLRVNTP